MSDEAIRKLVDEAQEFIPPNDNQPSPPIRQPAVGSDVDLAKCVLDDLSAQLGRIVFAEGAFWHFIGTHWIEVPLHRLQLAVQQYDGRTYLTQNNTMAQIKLNETRVKSVIKMMEPIVSDPEFLEEYFRTILTLARRSPCFRRWRVRRRLATRLGYGSPEQSFYPAQQPKTGRARFSTSTGGFYHPMRSLPYRPGRWETSGYSPA
jgi:hypothetical protein